MHAFSLRQFSLVLDPSPKVPMTSSNLRSVSSDSIFKLCSTSEAVCVCESEYEKTKIKFRGKQCEEACGDGVSEDCRETSASSTDPVKRTGS